MKRQYRVAEQILGNSLEELQKESQLREQTNLIATRQKSPLQKTKKLPHDDRAKKSSTEEQKWSAMTPSQKLRDMVKKVVAQLYIDASPQHDLNIRSQLKEELFSSSLTIDVQQFGKEFIVTFYTAKDDNLRRLLQGHEREFKYIMSEKRLKIREIRFEHMPDPDQGNPVLLYRHDKT